MGCCYERGSWATASQLRQLFTTIVVFCEVSNALALWNSHWKSMAEDITYQLQRIFTADTYVTQENNIKNKTLAALEILFNANSTSLAFFNLPMPNTNTFNSYGDRLINEELDYNLQDLQSEHQLLLSNLNIEQKRIYDRILASVQVATGGFFILFMAMEVQARHTYGKQLLQLLDQLDILF